MLGEAQTETCCCVPCVSGVGHLDLNKGDVFIDEGAIMF